MTAWWLGLCAFFSILCGLVLGAFLVSLAGLAPEIDDRGKRLVDFALCLVLTVGFCVGGISLGADPVRAGMGTGAAMAVGAISNATRSYADEWTRLAAILVGWMFLLLSIALWAGGA